MAKRLLMHIDEHICRSFRQGCEDAVPTKASGCAVVGLVGTCVLAVPLDLLYVYGQIRGRCTYYKFSRTRKKDGVQNKSRHSEAGL